MCFSLGNPTPLANEGGIYHPHRCGRCRGDSDPSAWEQFTLFPLIVPEKCDSCGEKALQYKKKKASRGRHNRVQQSPLPKKCRLPRAGSTQGEGNPAERFSTATTVRCFSRSACDGMKVSEKSEAKTNSACAAFRCINEPYTAPC